MNTTALQSKADHPQTGYTDPLFCGCDLDLHPMTLIYESDLKILRPTCTPKITFLGQCFRTLKHHRQTHKHATERITPPVIINNVRFGEFWPQ